MHGRVWYTRATTHTVVLASCMQYQYYTNQSRQCICVYQHAKQLCTCLPTNDIVYACKQVKTEYTFQPVCLVCLSLPTSVSEYLLNVANVFTCTSDSLEDWISIRESSQYSESYGHTCMKRKRFMSSSEIISFWYSSDKTVRKSNNSHQHSHLVVKD